MKRIRNPFRKKPYKTENSIKKQKTKVPETKVPEAKVQEIPVKNTFQYFPKNEYRKLNILLLENSPVAVEHKQNIIKIIKNFKPKDFICVINYGESIKKGEICRLEKFNIEQILNEEFKNDKVLFYEALAKLNEVVSTNYKIILEDSNERSKIDEICIVGIGTGLDAGSEISKEDAIKSFNMMVNNHFTETKYFCFTENTFMNVAAIGFRSIGSFPQKQNL